ncbi:CHAP domain-containing protein [Sphingobacterium detergens]|uniref:CHAP domain-containing protein n=1 Tax=Sphingobacterium detergens TaxID=1145106 RepID=A0A420BKD5_SPHD1|nr:CHAP domain-containing protein [Sphingobacterium detergens]RKE57172.1 CHAP domain-containing protein [Sphingobacterium detergens]
MATMYSLFYGVLFITVLFLGGIGYRAVEREIAEVQPKSMAMGARPGPQDRMVALRKRIVDIAVGEIGVREVTGSNDGSKVEEYLAYTDLGKGHAWCAAFVSWCYSQAGHLVPRNAWSPALFPIARRYTSQQIRAGSIRPADLFAIYNQRLGRINHVGIVRKIEGNWLLTIEGNVADRVLSKRRPRATVYAFSNWLD